ncbi:MAG: site-2 protease family protein [Sedimenticola sp.]|uniref:Site-2 protease family protein n=1 Tax=Sedimenticola thiotaurini TaxID=1543721 RepID=A0A558D1R7_9GAMM|nr:site-2 protease family protein [Sedimenticola sp.]MCW8949883.1 site-2 protease family protein [Sedimenticola sp.]MDF1528568.1 site-2 protease family protein [Sedimenticola sp.]TVT54962.1 MAG: site-2 protease family protein [Sedimenticola thiotaurini]
MEGLTTIQKLAVLFLPVLFAITVHEAAHGWMAKRLGDQTAAILGRVTLNPLKHIDLIGTIVVPMAMFALTGFLFGWAKPVPVDFRNLRQPRRDMALVAIAGPGANLIMAILWAGLIHLGIILGDDYAWFALPMIYMGSAGILINAFLMVLNLIPILPLDGGRVVASLLPPRLAMHYSRLEPWGLMIVVALLFSGVLGSIIHPGVGLVQSFSAWVVGLG